MKDIIRTCNLTVIFSKFTLNIKIYEKFEELEEKLCSSLGGYRSNKVYYIGNIYIVRTKFGAQAQVYGILVQ